MTPQPSPPPPVLDCARVIEYAVLNESVGYSGRTLLFVDGKELGQVPCLAICADKKSPGVMLFHCDREWTVLGCSGHPSIPEAKDRAERIYPGLSACWVDAHISEEQAEQYLDELLGDQQCSFCDKRADQVEQLIQRDDARICDRCINEFHTALHEPSPK
jgi:ClpX C4-type zinc finger